MVGWGGLWVVRTRRERIRDLKTLVWCRRPINILQSACHADRGASAMMFQCETHAQIQTCVYPMFFTISTHRQIVNLRNCATLAPRYICEYMLRRVNACDNTSGWSIWMELSRARFVCEEFIMMCVMQTWHSHSPSRTANYYIWPSAPTWWRRTRRRRDRNVLRRWCINNENWSGQRFIMRCLRCFAVLNVGRSRGWEYGSI